MPSHRNPWDRLPTETANQWTAFRHYLFMDPDNRSILAAAGEFFEKERISRPSASLQGIERTWYGWSSKNRWVERVTAYDDHIFQEQVRRIERERLKLALKRARFEIEQHDEIERRAKRMTAKLDKLEEMPSTDVEQAKYNEDGQIISEQKVRGIKPSELARFVAAWLAVLSVGINGHVRTSRSERVDDKEGGPGGGQKAVGGPMHLVLDVYPEEQGDAE